MGVLRLQMWMSAEMSRGRDVTTTRSVRTRSGPSSVDLALTVDPATDSASPLTPATVRIYSRQALLNAPCGSVLSIFSYDKYYV